MDDLHSMHDIAQEMSAADQDFFYRDLTAAEPLVAVLKAALYIESQVVHLLESHLGPEYLNKMDLTYSQRVFLAAAVGMPPRLIEPLKALGEIRNKFAHQLDATLSKNEADNFYKTFHEIEKDIIQGVYRSTIRPKHSKLPSRFKSLPPIDRFTVCVVALRAALLAARALLRERT